ncbi:hypothetical protein HZS_7414 [Henneguya salminicola]|nr:hypothetical protein HZS_7414 [Henneguya salminicola]
MRRTDTWIFGLNECNKNANGIFKTGEIWFLTIKRWHVNTLLLIMLEEYQEVSYSKNRQSLRGFFSKNAVHIKHRRYMEFT